MKSKIDSCSSNKDEATVHWTVLHDEFSSCLSRHLPGYIVSQHGLPQRKLVGGFPNPRSYIQPANP